MAENTCAGPASRAKALLEGAFGAGPAPAFISVPGRIAIIGDHIDYHNLPVLAMAIQRRISIAFRMRNDKQLRAISSGEYGCRNFPLTLDLRANPSGDWSNYMKAAADAVQKRWSVSNGIDAAVISDLPPAAGLSSSSALVAGFMIALLRANEIYPTLNELLEVLPEAEQFVGTRGGGMDHAAVLASRRGCALLIGFSPFQLSEVHLPEGWSFLIAHSLTSAEKSGAARLEYNARRSAGDRALEKLGFAAYRAAIGAHSWPQLLETSNAETPELTDEEKRAFLHVVSEGIAVQEAVSAIRAGNAARFGQLLFASHASLRDRLRVSCPALDEIVSIAEEEGALGARVTGAGFGGCAIIFCHSRDTEQISERLIQRFYSHHQGFNRRSHLIVAEPSSGAMVG